MPACLLGKTFLQAYLIIENTADIQGGTMHILLVLAALLSPFSFAESLSELNSLVQKANQIDDYEVYRIQFSESALLEELKKVAASHNTGRLCSGLRAIEYKDQLLFLNAIEAHPDWRYLSCFRSWVRSVQKQTRRVQHQLKQSVEMGLFAPSSYPSHNTQNDKLGPSEDRVLLNEAQNLPWDDRLPEGTFALTFDDGPHGNRTLELIEILQHEDIQATFFVLGERIENHPEILQRLLDQNHSLAGHTYSHPDLSRRTFDSAVEEIEHGFDTIEEAVGNQWPLFRFPYGARTNRLMDYLVQRNTHHFFWNVDTLDWKKRDPEELLNYAIRQTERNGRGIILFHDIHPQTIAIMPAFLRKLKQNNYKIVVYRSQ
jgi:peptidoglycan/xylan/chitin deacetylase (PgdA/CDA1 family)